MLTRMPAKWGKLRPYFLCGLVGVPVLTILAAAMPHVMRGIDASSHGWLTAIAVLTTLMILWIGTLVQLRSQHNPRRDWPWTWPVCLVLIGLNWVWPLSWSIALVYVHPFVALWFLFLRMNMPTESMIPIL